MKNLLTEKDFYLIDTYRRNFANNSNELCSTEYFLRYWYKAKSDHLFNIFNGSLIHSKEVSYKPSLYELRKDTYYSSIIDKIEETAARIRSYFANGEIDIYIAIRELLSTETLYTNLYTNETIAITNEFKLRKGSKALKAIQKLNDIFNFFSKSKMDEFISNVSLLKNVAKTTGTLSLSIHPLDFITSSNQTNGWSSCYVWPTGEYNQSTIEYMNSPYIAVAYLNSSTPYTPFDDRNWEWNNKKWRCFFIITPTFISSIKSYPNKNAFLEQEALKLAAMLAGRAEEARCSDPQDWFYEVYTNYAYNDYEHVHEVYHIGELTDNLAISGQAMCAFCGKEENIYDHTIYCCNCSEYDDEEDYFYCNNCGERHHIDDECWFDDERYCPDCYHDLVVQDILNYHTSISKDQSIAILFDTTTRTISRTDFLNLQLEYYTATYTVRPYCVPHYIEADKLTEDQQEAICKALHSNAPITSYLGYAVVDLESLDDSPLYRELKWNYDYILRSVAETGTNPR